MRDNDATPSPRTSLAFGAGMLLVGLLMLAGTRQIGSGLASAVVGPRIFPLIIASGMSLIGIVMMLQSFRQMRQSAFADVQTFHFAPVAWIVAALGLQILTLQWLGWIPAAAMLFAACARAFGSQRWALNLSVGIVLAALCFVLFNQVLGLQLPLGHWVTSLFFAKK